MTGYDAGQSDIQSSKLSTYLFPLFLLEVSLLMLLYPALQTAPAFTLSQDFWLSSYATLRLACKGIGPI
jgi:hypothetical protein